MLYQFSPLWLVVRFFVVTALNRPRTTWESVVELIISLAPHHQFPETIEHGCSGNEESTEASNSDPAVTPLLRRLDVFAALIGGPACVDV